MSTSLAIAGVSHAMRDLLNDGLVNHNVSGILGSTVTVTLLPPDRVVPATGSESSQLNLFLHRVTPNQGWRNEGLPARDASGRQRLSNPPLALDLHYLLSAYSQAELHGEILLGYGMQLFHQNPVLSRQALRTSLSPSPAVGTSLPPALRALADSGIADQVEQVKITPEYLNTEEMSKLWSSTQANYRPTAAYEVTVVLIESLDPVRMPLPVTSRGPRDPATGRERGVVAQASLIPPVPVLDGVTPAGDQPVARLGETIALSGHNLDGTARQVRLVLRRFQVDELLPATGASEPRRLEFTIPQSRSADVPVGLYEVSADLIRPPETAPRRTNRLGLVVAPEPTNLPMAVVVDVAGTATFSLTLRPQVRQGQTVTLVLGQEEYLPEPFTPPTASLDFVIPNAPLGNHLARLRVDGIEGPIVDRSADPPAFYDHRIDIT